jgi:hypothetical protein
MKINRFFAMAAIALLVVGTMGVISYRALAQGNHNPVTQSQDCSLDQTDEVELQASDTDTDNTELQCGDQNDAEAEDRIGAADVDNDDIDEQVGDQNASDDGVEAPETDRP